MGKRPNKGPTSPGFVPVCAIGASAGGVAALQTLFRLLPDDLGLAYVVVVHLAPDHPSAMHEILGACTRMPVFQVEDGPHLRANCVYVIAPDRELVIEGDDIKSRPFSDARGRRAPIDMFFRSVASGRGDGVAVVLTGAGSDGAQGVRAIKEAGGIIMVQEPSEAAFPSMPQSAIATGAVDVVAPLARLAERITEAAHSKEAVRSLDEDHSANDVRRIVAFLRTRTGHDFSGYKRSTVLRRITRRMQVCQILELADYAQYLRDNPEEAKELLSDLLISVTMFFRDPSTYVALTHLVIRPLLESRSDGEDEDGLRAWVVGCATGEEAYSLAIILLEEAERAKISVPIQIFATDLDEGALATAREGRYPRTIEADVTAERLKRFFVDEGTHYRIDRRVRDLVLFATHSVVREPPFMRLNLITCRNLLIYLERSLQQHVCGIFHYSLRPDGYLFLGTAETADSSQKQFAVVDREARIYRALPAGSDFVPSLISASPPGTGRPVLTEHRIAASRFDAGEVLGASHAAALEDNAPPSALVDTDHAVMHLSPSVGRFILLSAGPLSGRLPSIVRPELRLDLKLALDRVFETREPTITRLIDVQLEGELRRISLHIAPVPTNEGAAPRAIVYFLDNGPGRAVAEEDQVPPDELQHLHSELKVSQEAELAGRIRHETAVQELRASNEELQSLNEEYRSTAEELETSKEELQSINEELQTVNAELKSKLAIISAAHNDLQNLTDSSEIGTLFLDLDLRIRMFTPPVADVFNITEGDIGRPITDFTHRLAYESVERDVRGVLRDQKPTETEVRSLDEGWFLMRIRPYRTLDGVAQGAVVTFDDITDRKQTAQTLTDELRIMTRMHDLGDRLLAISDLKVGLGEVLDAAMDVFNSDRGTCQILDPETQTLSYAASRGFDEAALALVPPIDRDFHSTCAVCIRTGERIVADNIASDPRWADHAPTALSLGYDAALSSPMKTRRDELLGVLTVHFEQPYAPSDRELRWSDLFARSAAHLVERARAEVAVRESEERFQQFAQASAAGLWIRDAATLAMEYTSPAVASIYGVEDDALLGDIERWAAMIVPEDRQIVFDHIDQAREGQSVTYEFRIQRPSDRSFRWIRNSGFPLRENGHVPRIGGITEDFTDAKLAVEHQSVLLAELQHRVRNIMGVIRSMANRSAKSGSSVDEYRSLLEGRMLALARVQALLTREANVGGSLREIIEVNAQADGQHQFELTGPDVMLPPKGVEVLTLAFHELATNALKYGALSVPDGRLSVEWSAMDRNGATWLVLDWTEQGAPTRNHPTRRGFGSELIEARIPYELGGKGKLTIEPDGAHCHFEFPLQDGESILETDAPMQITTFGGTLDMTGAPDLTDCRVLVVEDDYYMAADTAAALRGAGAEVLGPCPTVDAARDLIENGSPTRAVLDLNLGGGGPRFETAYLLKERGVPFLFLTGYDPDVIPADLADVVRLQKPVQFRTIVDAVAEL